MPRKNPFTPAQQTLAERMRQVREALRIERWQFGQFFGVGESVITGRELNRNAWPGHPSPEAIAQIEAEFVRMEQSIAEARAFLASDPAQPTEAATA